MVAIPRLEGVPVLAVERPDLGEHSFGGGVPGGLSVPSWSLGSTGAMVENGAINLRLVKRCCLLELLGLVESLQMLKPLELFVGEVEGHGECCGRSGEERRV